MTGHPPHRADHTDLLSTFVPRNARDVEGVIVPSARGAGHLRTAAEVAAQLEAPLLVLCSADSVAAEIGPALDGIPGLEVHAVDATADAGNRWLPPSRPARGWGGRVPLSRKRNLGLLVARTAGWRTALFLDDDIRYVPIADVRRAASGLGPRTTAVGLEVTEFPDHSAVCHANRLSGGRQRTFVSGSALLVDVDAPDLAHFPSIYNEDWLFLFDALRRHRVSRTGEVRQMRYDPFLNAGRGYREEFGEVIAEGLVHHLHDGGDGVPVDRAHWADFLRRRAAFLDEVRHRSLDTTALSGPRRLTLLESLTAAARRLTEITPLDCTAFLRSWRTDQQWWCDRVGNLPDHAGDPARALRHLGFRTIRSAGARTWHRRPLPPPRPLVGEVRTAASEAGAALIVPGFLDGSANPAHHELATTLPGAGWTSIAFDPRGSVTRPDEPFSAGPTEHLADIAVLLRKHAPDRRALIGHSYGAWLALLHAAIDPRVTHVVAVMPTRCFLWAEDYDRAEDRWSANRERVFSSPLPGSEVLGGVRVPYAVVEDALHYDLPAALATLTKPVLFIAGADDAVVPPAAVERLYDECAARSEDKTFVVLPGVRHDYRDNAAMTEQVTATIVDWLVERGSGAMGAAFSDRAVTSTKLATARHFTARHRPPENHAPPIPQPRPG